MATKLRGNLQGSLSVVTKIATNNLLGGHPKKFATCAWQKKHALAIVSNNRILSLEKKTDKHHMTS